MQLVDYSSAQELPVVLMTNAGVAITGAVFSDITARYKKYGGSWTAKTLTAGNWREEGLGVYYISFLASDLDTYGAFAYQAVHASGYFTDIVTVTDYASEADLLQDLYDLTALRVSRTDIMIRERDLDKQMEYLTAQANRLDDAIAALEAQAAGLRARIADL